MDTAYCVKLTEFNTASVTDENGAIDVFRSDSSLIIDLDSAELDNVNGCGGHQAVNHCNRRRAETKSSTFAGPEGAGSTFSHKEEEISAGASDFSWD